METGAGELCHRVEIQTNTPSVDAAGQAIASWATSATVWGKVDPLYGTKLESARTLAATATHAVRMRYRTVTVSNRLRHRGRTFEVLSVLNEDEARIWIDLLCKEVV